MELRLLGTVEQYQESFDALLKRVDLPVNYVVRCFLTGLSDEIHTTVRMCKPQTLHDTYFVAKLQETILAFIARRARPILDKPSSFVRSTTF